MVILVLSKCDVEVENTISYWLAGCTCRYHFRLSVDGEHLPRNSNETTHSKAHLLTLSPSLCSSLFTFPTIIIHIIISYHSSAALNPLLI